jgi:lipopolysaccharide exporter
MDGLDTIIPAKPDNAEADAGMHSLAKSGSILSRTAQGAGWVIGWRMTTRLLGLFSTFILVRLLTPTDFGIVALTMSFLQGISSLSEMGVQEAIIRADRSDRSIYDAGFTINVIRSISTSLILMLAAYPLGHFFHNKNLPGVIFALSAMFVLSGFENIGMVDFRRFLAFNMEFKIKIFPRLLSIGVAIPVAYYTHSYWALVAAIWTGQLMTLILSYTMHPYRPRFSFAGMGQIAGFSFWMWVNSLIGLVGGRVTTIYLGRLLGAGAIGIYGVGMEVATLASAEIVAPMGRALFSGFAAARKEGDNGAETMLRVLSLMSLVTFPLSVGTSLVAYPIIRIGFGPEWLTAVPIVQVVGVATTLTLFGAVSGTLFAAHAWLKSMVWMNIASMVLRVVLAVVLIPRYGILGGALAVAAMDVLQQLLYLIMAVRRLKLRLFVILMRSIRPIIGVVIMTVILTRLNLAWTDWPGTIQQLSWRLAETVALGGVIYTVSVILMWLGAGRPIGGETDALLMINRMLKRA